MTAEPRPGDSPCPNGPVEPAPAPPVEPADLPATPATPGGPADTPAVGARPAKRRGPGQGKGPRGTRLVRHFSIDEQLAADDRVAYEALLLDPRQTVSSLLEWLRGRGYRISRGSVHRHRHQFETDVKDIRKNARVAVQFSALARASGGAGGLADAGQFRLEQMFLEQLFTMKGDERLSGKEWGDFGKAMTALLDNRQKYETLRQEWDERARKAAEVVEQASGKKTKAFNGVAIANTVRRILGVPLPGEPTPGSSKPGPSKQGMDGLPAWARNERVSPQQAAEDEARSIDVANEVRRELGAPPVSDGRKDGPALPPPGEN